MKILKMVFEKGHEFLDTLVQKDEGQLLRHTPKNAIDKGEQILLEIHFPELPNRVLLRGEVAQPSKLPKEPVLLRVIPEDQTALSFIIGMAKKEKPPEEVKPREHDRIPLEVPVDWSVQGSGDLIISSTDDVGGGGVQIRTLSPPKVGTRMKLEFVLGGPGSEHISVPGEVAWVRQDAEFQGMGVRFTSEGDKEMDKLRALLQRIRKNGESEGD